MNITSTPENPALKIDFPEPDATVAARFSEWPGLMPLLRDIVVKGSFELRQTHNNGVTLTWGYDSAHWRWLDLSDEGRALKGEIITAIDRLIAVVAARVREGLLIGRPVFDHRTVMHLDRAIQEVVTELEGVHACSLMEILMKILGVSALTLSEAPELPETFYPLRISRTELARACVKEELEYELSAPDKAGDLPRATVCVTLVSDWLRPEIIPMTAEFQAVEQNPGMFEGVKRMNEAFGNPEGLYQDIDLGRLEKQCHYLKDEVDQELLQVFEKGENLDLRELRDVLSDIMVFALGAYHLMGADAEADMLAVYRSNMSKFCRTEEELEATREKYRALGVPFYEEGEFPARYIKCAEDCVAVTGEKFKKGKFLKGVSYKPPVFVDPA